MNSALNILYQDEHLVAIEKPAGLIVHRNEYTQGEVDNLLNRAAGQLRKYLFPVHRLDRPTAGLIVFALSKEASASLAKAFSARKVNKYYLAIVKGTTPPQGGSMDRPLRRKPRPEYQVALTHYKTLASISLPISIGPFDTSSYSLVEVHPITGRYHQIRRHFSYVHHPLIGDKKHGHKDFNRVFLEELNLPGLMLQSYRLEFDHPVTGEPMRLKSPIAPHIQVVMDRFGWEIEELTGSQDLQD